MSHQAAWRPSESRGATGLAASRKRIPVRQSIGGQATASFLGIPGVDSTNLGRPLSSGIPVEFLIIVEPGPAYGDRLNSIDLRFGKILRYPAADAARRWQLGVVSLRC
jgi:hypothetical protein